MLCFILLGWLGVIVLMCFFILSIAAGLYYLAELVEEFTVTSAKVIRTLNWFVIGIYLCLLLFENVSIYLILCGLLSHLNHILILRTFPFFKVTSIPFVSFLVLLLVNHYFTFSYFAQVHYHFTQVISYFTICLWLIPFAFFVSLSANDNVLPTSIDSRTHDDNDLISHYFSRRTERAGLLSLFNYAKGSILPQQVKKAY